MINLKVRLCIILVTGMCISASGQQNIDQIQVNSSAIKRYSDSLQYFIQLLNQKKITEIEFQFSINRVSSELSNLAGSNFEMTYHIADSIYYAQYLPTEPIPEEPLNGTSATSSEMQDHSNDFDTTNFNFKPKKNLTATALQMVLPDPTRRTKVELSIKFGFNGSNGLDNKKNYPQFKEIQNFYFQYLGIGLKTRIGGQSSRLFLRYGVGLDYLSLKQKDNIRILRNTDEKAFFIDPKSEGINNLEEYKIRLKYLKFPLGLQFKLTKNVSFQINAFYNLLLRQRTYSKFSVDSDHDEVSTLEKDFKLNKNIFGMEYAIGYKRFNLFFEQSLNNLLNNKSDEQLKYFKIGIGIR